MIAGSLTSVSSRASCSADASGARRPREACKGPEGAQKQYDAHKCFVTWTFNADMSIRMHLPCPSEVENVM